MRLLHIHRAMLHCVAGFGLLASMASAQGQSNFAKQTKSSACPNDDGTLKLPPGFCASVFADGIGHARHLVVSADGLVYVNTWSSPYYGRDAPHPGGFVVVLQDKNSAGKADIIECFGETPQSGGAGGTGIALYQGWIYAQIDDRIVRYALSAGPMFHRVVRKLSSQVCLSRAIIPCIRSSSTLKDRCTSMLPLPATPAK